MVDLNGDGSKYAFPKRQFQTNTIRVQSSGIRITAIVNALPKGLSSPMYHALMCKACRECRIGR